MAIPWSSLRQSEVAMSKTKSSNAPRVSTLRLCELVAACDAVMNAFDNRAPIGPDSIVTVTRHYNGVLDIMIEV